RTSALQLEPAPLLLSIIGRQVLVGEDVPDLITRDLAALGISLRLHDTAELDLQLAGQIEGVVSLQQVGDATLARLRIDADYRLIAAAQIFRVDRQIRHSPFEFID